MSLQPPRHPMPRGSKPLPAGRAPRLHTRPCLQARAPPAAASSHRSRANLACSPANRLLPLLLQPGSPRCLPQPPPRPLPAARVRSAALPRLGPTAAASFSSSASSSSSAPGCSAQSPRQAPPSPAPPRRQPARPAPGRGRSLTPPAPVPAPGVPASALGAHAAAPRGEGGMPVSAGGWGCLGRLGRGVGSSRAGTERCGPRQSAPPPRRRGPQTSSSARPCTLGGRGSFGVGMLRELCLHPDQEEEGAVTFSDCGQGTAAASLGGSGDVRRCWRGKLPPSPSPGLRGAEPLSCVLSAFLGDAAGWQRG